MNKKSLTKNIYLCYTILFLIVGIVIFCPLLLRHNSFVAMGDSMNQNYPILIYLSRYYKSFFSNLLNMTIPMYDTSIGFGDDIIGALSWFGFGDIFMLPAVLCPERYMSYAYTLITILRFYLAGIAFIFYGKYKKYSNDTIILAALIYSYSNYALGNGLIFFPFATPMVYFPIFAYGIDRITSDKNKSRKFIPEFVIVIFLQALTGFYFLYVDILYCFIFFITNLILQAFFSKKKNSLATYVKQILCLAVHFLVGCGMASIVFVPALFEYLNCLRTGDSSFALSKLISTYSVNQINDLIKNILAPCSPYDVGMCIPVIVAVAVFIMILGFSKYRTYKVFWGCLAVIFGYFFPVVGTVFNGFAYSTSRWFYILYFVLCCVFLKISNEKFDGDRNSIIILSIIIAIVWALSYCFLSRNDDAMVMRLVEYSVIWVLFISAFFIKDVVLKRKALFILTIINVGFSGFLGFASPKIGGMDNRSLYKGLNFVYDEIKESDLGKYSTLTESAVNSDSFYRCDYNDTILNGSLMMKLNTTYSYYSICNGSIYRIFEKLRVSPAINDDFTLEGLDSRQILESILSVNKLNIYNGEKSCIGDNEYYLPLGIVYDNCVSEKYADSQSVLQRMNLLMDNVIIESSDTENIDEDINTGNDFGAQIDLPYTISYSNGIVRNGNEISAHEGDSITISFNTDNEEFTSDKELYLCLENFTSNPSFESYVDIAGKKVRLRPVEDEWYYYGNFDYYVQIQNIAADGKITIVFEDTGKYNLDNIVLIENDCSHFGEKYDRLKASCLQNLNMETNGFSGMINTDSNGWLFVSYPYSSGWKCKIDGQYEKIVRADYSFMAVEVAEGTHSVEFIYVTPGIELGSIISIVSFLLFISTTFYGKNKSRRLRNKVDENF